MLAKARESIEAFGFIDPLTVWDSPHGYIIIDGEHRYSIGIAMGMTEFPVVILAGIDELTAKRLTVALNEISGQPLPDLLSALLDEITSSAVPGEETLAIPFTDEMLSGFLSAPLPALPEEPNLPANTSRERFVERLYRLPVSVASLLDDAIAEAIRRADIEDGSIINDAGAIERICAEYMAGNR